MLASNTPLDFIYQCSCCSMLLHTHTCHSKNWKALLGIVQSSISTFTLDLHLTPCYTHEWRSQKFFNAQSPYKGFLNRTGLTKAWNDWPPEGFVSTSLMFSADLDGFEDQDGCSTCLSHSAVGNWAMLLLQNTWWCCATQHNRLIITMHHCRSINWNPQHPELVPHFHH